MICYPSDVRPGGAPAPRSVVSVRQDPVLRKETPMLSKLLAGLVTLAAVASSLLPAPATATVPRTVLAEDFGFFT